MISMKKNIFYSILFGLFSATICTSLVATNSIDSFALEKNDSIDYTAYGFGDEDIDYVSDVPCYVQSSDSTLLRSTIILPSSVDLSETSYFPPIGNQQQMGSCVAWATTYYQFTYEANKLNNIVTTKENSYSPAWTFNLWNGGLDEGSYNMVAYDILAKHGAVRWSENPYQTTDGKLDDIDKSNFDFNWCTDTNAMIKALDTRLTASHEIDVSSSEDLNGIKEKLYGTDGTDGKILNIRVRVGDNFSNWTFGERLDPETGEEKNEAVVYRAEGNVDGGHAMTIVGYDDNVWCDINNNNKVDEGELGAFKVANSWGDDWCNNGYVWIAYDALNYKTSIEDNEANNTVSRISIFDRNGGHTNRFYYIDVENKSPYYIGQLEINTDYRNSLEINAERNSTEFINVKERLKHYKGDIDSPISYDGTLVFDYDDLCEPISNYIDEYNWGVKITGNHKSLKFKVTDNLSNTIVDLGELIKNTSKNEYQADKPISLSMGDLNYNGVVDSVDSQIFSTGILSNLQKYLAKNMENGTGSSSNSSYTIDYKVAQDWGAGQNIEITITNTGDAPIRNWALQCDNFYGTITTFWNCKLQGDNIIRCQDYNTDIPVGSSITMGYILTNATGDTPKFNLCSFRDAKQDGYSVDFNVTAEWGENFIGEIKITNTTDEPIMAWELNFDTVNFTISATNQFEILTNTNQNYTITGTYNGNIPIEPHSSIIMQFNGEKTGTPFLSNISMTEMKIKE